MESDIFSLLAEFQMRELQCDPIHAMHSQCRLFLSFGHHPSLRFLVSVSLSRLVATFQLFLCVFIEEVFDSFLILFFLFCFSLFTRTPPTLLSLLWLISMSQNSRRQYNNIFKSRTLTNQNELNCIFEGKSGNVEYQLPIEQRHSLIPPPPLLILFPCISYSWQ